MVLLLSTKHGRRGLWQREAWMLLRGWDENIDIDGHPEEASEDQPTAASALDDQGLMAVGVSELRVRGEDDIDRVFTTRRRRPQGVIVLHAFIKRPDGR